jgi:TonB family protein
MIYLLASSPALAPFFACGGEPAVVAAPVVPAPIASESVAVAPPASAPSVAPAPPPPPPPPPPPRSGRSDLVQAPLGPAAVPFAKYLNHMHNRIHPLFADEFLVSLDKVPAASPLNNPDLKTTVELVLGRDGSVVRMGITRTSGVTLFDVSVLDSVQRAAPFGPAPSDIVSADGHVYVRWTFLRDKAIACSTMNAQPYLLVQHMEGSVTPSAVPSSAP